MGMDQDFPITGTQVKVLLVGLLVMGAFGAALFGGTIPGLKPNYSQPNFLVVGGEPYYFTTLSLAMPNLFLNYTLPQSFTFHNVTFALWVSGWGLFSGGLVHGNGTEADGTVYAFVLGESTTPPVNTTLFLSPDRLFAVYWLGGLLGGTSVRLMVHV
ncbi:MAG TPA: hypothetical protein VGG32_09520 [Thermoplasmata archaeon]|jgi:hypothetical protein